MTERLQNYADFTANHTSPGAVVSDYLESMAQNDPYQAPTAADLAYSHSIALSWARRLWSTHVEYAQINLRRRVDLIRVSRA